ncbi:hypothetical protein VCRA2123O444_330001 [Vibrio crassostreae]|uniref:hypothetical protein n=1 Tax=Vibrio crassostreae TaxID=246167 RepID=UPI001B312B72|nr:hypothetical protein [Vibrio crassostreae]CAK2022836.1 hypothetical protein VCRA2117O428_320001 [Vibrio crassostreae]CAK2024231.1 hypothetical protein VCRA2113O416_330001 [Vibrio crassostreae]CAK2036051.1 hypothetical protein VCRA2119O430_330044 [Vibrio crassostreae]CAK2036235.1 hypothetical protein VCRA2114O422_340045 [Vibrio crassostreae]CAK2037037.1 hypothetical protein VCRA2119O431_330045 [Vibrio crassostreae]
MRGLWSAYSKRIDTQYSTTGDIDLDEHLNQLKSLYKQLPKEIDTMYAALANLVVPAAASATVMASIMGTTYKCAEIESYDDFIKNIISEKKTKIRSFLKVDT